MHRCMHIHSWPLALFTHRLKWNNMKCPKAWIKACMPGSLSFTIQHAWLSILDLPGTARIFWDWLAKWGNNVPLLLLLSLLLMLMMMMMMMMAVGVWFVLFDDRVCHSCACTSLMQVYPSISFGFNLPLVPHAALGSICPWLVWS